MEHTLGLLLLQIGVILLISRIMGMLVRFLGQPQVVGEMLAGIVLGPSVLGLWHDNQLVNLLFPPSSLGFLNILAEIGVMFFMFVIGLELDPMHLRKQGRSMMVMGSLGIVIPFAAGIGMTLLLMVTPGFQSVVEGTKSFSALALFMGTAMSITAFPVLARIILERNMQRNNLGIMALATAAINDVLGWCILSVVVAYTRVKVSGDDAAGHSLGTAAFTVLWAALFIAAMLLIVRPLLMRLQTYFDLRGYLSQSILAGIFLLLLLSSVITDYIGIHAIFGAFLLGAVMPSKPEFVRHLSEKFEDFTIIFLLPIFFALTGLRTRLGLLDDGNLWLICALVVAVATAGKFGGVMLASRMFKINWRHSATLGVLMNTRGLMELVILNIGYDLGILSPALFTIMVVMALATTFMTTPLLALVYPRKVQQAEDHPAPVPPAPKHRDVLVPVSLAHSAPALVRVARMLMGADPGTVHLLHMQRAEDTEELPKQGKEDPLVAGSEEARALGILASTRSFVTNYAARDITSETERLNPDWVIIGYHKPVFMQSILGGTARGVLNETPANIGILIDKGLEKITRVLVPYLGGPQDHAALVAAERLSQMPNVEVTILHVVHSHRGSEEKPLGVRDLMNKYVASSGAAQQVHFSVIESDSPTDVVTAESHRYDLMILGLAEEWNLDTGILSLHEESVAQLAPCSILIVRGALKP